MSAQYRYSQKQYQYSRSDLGVFYKKKQELTLSLIYLLNVGVLLSLIQIDLIYTLLYNICGSSIYSREWGATFNIKNIKLVNSAGIS